MKNTNELLWRAIKIGNIDNVKFMLDNDADRCGYTPLMRVIDYGHTDIAKYLIKRRADICAKHNETLATPLSVAAEKGNVEMDKQLVSLGIDVDIQDQYGTTFINRIT